MDSPLRAQYNKRQESHGHAPGLYEAVVEGGCFWDMTMV